MMVVLVCQFADGHQRASRWLSCEWKQETEWIRLCQDVVGCVSTNRLSSTGRSQELGRKQEGRFWCDLDVGSGGE